MTRRKPLFVYLISSGKTPAIGIASRPTERVHSHNRVPGFPAGSKSTRAGAPNWQLQMVIGPFYSGARVFHTRWREHSRKLACRIAFGCIQGLAFADKGVRVWARNPRLVTRMCEDVLRRRTRRLQAINGLDASIKVVGRTAESEAHTAAGG